MIVTTPDQLREVVDAYMAFDAFAFDVETKGEHRDQPRRNEVFWISLAGPGRGDVIPMGHPLGRLLQPAMKVKLPEADCPAPFRCARCSKGQRTLKDGSVSRALVNHNLAVLTAAPPAQLTYDEVWPVLAPLFASDKMKVGQNVKFDAQSLVKYLGFLVKGPLVDIFAAARILDENHKSYKLGDQVRRAFDFVYDKLGKEGVENFPFEEAAQYSYLDSKYTWLLWRKYLVELEREGLLDLFMKVEVPLTRVVCKMELHGADVDPDGFQKLHDKLEFRVRQLEADIEEANGGPINLNADAAVRELVYEKRGHKVTLLTDKTKEPSTSIKALEVLAYKNHRLDPDRTIDSNIKDRVIANIIERNQLYKLWSTYMHNNLDAVMSEGKLYGQFDQLGTDTGRFSSSKPNLQNIPVRQGKDIRDLFIAGPGRKLIVADYSQIELRILAHFTQDPMLLKAYRENLDLHEITARAAYGIPVDKEVIPKRRMLAKNVNFSVIYMGTAWTIMTRYEVPEKEAELVVDGFHKAYPKVKPWQQKELRIARRRHQKRGDGQRYIPPYTETAMGRRRRLPDLMWADDGIRRRAERQAVNAIIQGTAADIAKVAMVKLDNQIEEEQRDWHLTMVVHDEFVVSVPEGETEEAVATIKEAMIGASMLTVPLEVGISVVDRWSDGK